MASWILCPNLWRPRRPNQTGRTLVPTQDRIDNQLTKLLRHISGSGNGKYDARDVGTRMTNLSEISGFFAKLSQVASKIEVPFHGGLRLH